MRTTRIWVYLGGVRLNLTVHLFFKTKLMVLAQYTTIAAGKKFQGKKLTAPYVLQPGWVIGWRWEGNGAQRWRVYYHVKSIYDLERMLGHAIAGEQEAEEEVELSLEEAREVVRSLRAYWPLSPEQRHKLAALLAQVHERHEHARRESLRVSDEKVEATAGFTDRRGVLNPGASAARLTSAGTQLTVRLSEIRSIVPNLGRLQVAVIQELRRIQATLCERGLECVRSVRRVLKHDPAERDLRYAVLLLTTMRKELTSIRFAPFGRNCRYMEGEIDLIVKLLQDARESLQTRVAAVWPYLTTMLNSIAWKRAQWVLEQTLIKSLSMAVREEQCTERRRQATIRWLERFLVKASILKEDGFKRKRMRTVWQHMETAIVHLRDGELAKAKAALKSAAAVM